MRRILCHFCALGVMKCLIFIFTLCSIGTFIDGQSETDTDTESEQPDYVNLSLDSEDNQPEGSSEEDENNNPDDTSNGSEDEPGNMEPREIVIMHWDPKDKKDKSNKLQSETDTDTEFAPLEVNQPEGSSEEDENNNPGKTSNSSEDERNDEWDWDPEDKKDKEKKLDVMKLYMNEVEAGDMADLIGQNQHIQQSHVYNDLGRRSGPQGSKNNEAETPDYLIPEKAPPELVLLVAKESRLLRVGEDNDLNDFDRDKLLRSGNYWDGFWKEEVIPKNVIRSAPQEKQLGSIKAKINPGKEFYKVVSGMKKISPKLLYIINK